MKILQPALLVVVTLTVGACAGRPSLLRPVPASHAVRQIAADRTTDPSDCGLSPSAAEPAMPLIEYAGEGSRVMPLPLLNYNGERFHIGIGGAGWKLMETDSFELSAIGKLRFDGFDVDDLGREELASNGIDYQLLEDRDKALDLGLGMKWSGRAGEVEIELLADATDTSGGQEVSIQYGYPFALGKGRLTPNVSVSWQSKDMANYYYGTLDEEVARGVVDYKPGAVTLPSVGASYFRPIGEKWALMAFAKYSRLPDEIQDSPLIERDTKGAASVFIGFSRGF